MSATAHQVAISIHHKIMAIQAEIEKKYHATLELKELDKLADQLDHQRVPTQKESSLIQDYMKQAVRTLDDIENKLSTKWDKRGIHHSLIPLHDYFIGVSHMIERENQETIDQQLKIKHQHDKAQEKLKSRAEYMATHATETTHAAKPKAAPALKLKDAQALKIAATYSTLNLSPHTAWLTGSADKHSEQVDDELITKLDHAKKSISELTVAHERDELSHFHNHKVDTALAHYQQVLTKCQKSTGDDKTHVKHYTDCVHRLGQTKVNLAKVASHTSSHK